MRTLLKVIAVLGLFILQACSGGSNEIQYLGPAEFQKSIETKKGLLIDVRTPEEYVEGHIKGSATIDFYEPNFESKLNRLDRNKAIFVYCASGSRSGKTSKMAHTLGFKEIYTLKGGFNAWEESGLPVKR